MKLLIASDLHGSAHYCEKLLARIEAEQPDKILLLGDLLYHGPRNDLPQGYAPKQVIPMLNGLKDRIIAVRGNCDAEVDQMVLEFPIMADYTTLLLENGRTLFATHGHLFDPDHLPPRPAGSALDVGPKPGMPAERQSDTLILNPGSVSIPKDGSHSYMVYETPETVAALKGYVDVWLCDVKYISSEISKKYSDAADYFTVCEAAVKAMLEQAGPPVFDEEGYLQKGVILRHLALPGALADSLAVLDWMATLPKGSFIPSLMSQYTPFYKAKEIKPLDRRISTWEYRQVIDRAVELGLTKGYMQEKSSAKEEYTPPFDLEGV